MRRYSSRSILPSPSASWISIMASSSTDGTDESNEDDGKGEEEDKEEAEEDEKEEEEQEVDWCLRCSWLTRPFWEACQCA